MNLGNRVSQHDFSTVPNATIPRSRFNRSFGRKQTFNADYLVPIFLDEVLPGDTFNLSLTSFARLATPLVPFMDNMKVDYFFFFCPNRLIWDNWQKMNGEQTNPGDSTDFLIPQAATTTLTVTQNTLQNYMGLPIQTLNVAYSPISALPFRAYNLIWNEWFRDQNMQNSIIVDKDDGPDDPANYTLRKRGKRHDYFTSALPWPQKGPSVELPLGQTAPISGMTPIFGRAYGSIAGDNQSSQRWSTRVASTGFSPENNATRIVASSGGPFSANYTPTADRTARLFTTADYDLLSPGLESTKATVPWANFDHSANTAVVDLSDATAATINQLREAFQIQKLYERDARGGTRYTEILRSHFGVISPDARLQRPEYLGGGSASVNINPVAQTSSTDATTPQGNLAAFGTQVARNVGFQKSFVEHGYVIGLAAARADLSYQQGVNKLWNRRTRFDFYWPAFSHLGEQAVLNSEIYAQGTTDDQNVFGYQERYAEYRYKPSEILGTFMSTATGSLDIWHLAQNFGALPVLNSSFIESSTPVNRVIAVPTEPHFLWDGWFNYNCARPMPTYSVPGLIDHF